MRMIEHLVAGTWVVEVGRIVTVTEDLVVGGLVTSVVGSWLDWCAVNEIKTNQNAV
jgi:hypothetical protein